MSMMKNDDSKFISNHIEIIKKQINSPPCLEVWGIYLRQDPLWVKFQDPNRSAYRKSLRPILAHVKGEQDSLGISPVCGIGTFSNGSKNVAMRASREIAMRSKKEEPVLALIIIFQKFYHHYNSEILISSFSSSLFLSLWKSNRNGINVISRNIYFIIILNHFTVWKRKKPSEYHLLIP